VNTARAARHLAAVLASTALVVTAAPMLFDGGARADPAPPPATTTRAIHDGASTVAELRERRLRVPRVERGEPCPSADVNLRLNGVGPAVQAGPVAVALLGEEVALRYGQPESWRHRAKALWLVRADQPQPVIVRGKRIDRRGPVEFSNGERDFRTYPLTGGSKPGTSTAPPEWRDTPSNVLVRDSGCHAFQVDGPGFQSVFVLAAEPRMPIGAQQIRRWRASRGPLMRTALVSS
jgi:hypothetical protein